MAQKKGEVIIPENVRSIVTKYILHFNIDNTLLMPENVNQNREEQVKNSNIDLIFSYLQFWFTMPGESLMIKINSNLLKIFLVIFLKIQIVSIITAMLIK